jgi:hypothetical protein
LNVIGGTQLLPYAAYNGWQGSGFYAWTGVGVMSYGAITTQADFNACSAFLTSYYGKD